MSIDKAREAVNRLLEALGKGFGEPGVKAIEALIDAKLAERDAELRAMLAKPPLVIDAPAPADMRKPEDGGALERWNYDRTKGILEPNPHGYWTNWNIATATIAERDRRIADLEAGLETADSWLMLHARHVGSCLGKSLCTCGLTLVRAETGALLSGQQASEGRDG